MTVVIITVINYVINVIKRSSLMVKSACRESFGNHQCGFRNKSSASTRTIERIKWKHAGVVHQSFLDSQKAYDSAVREVLCNILTKFGIPRKPIVKCV